LYSSYCSIFCFLCSVLYITVCPFISFALTMMLSVFCQFLFVRDIVCLLSVSLCPWYCLSFVSFPLAMILSVVCQFPFGHVIVCLFQLPFGHDVVCRLRCTASGYHFDIFKPFLHSY
jgi:hypothetical protein